MTSRTKDGDFRTSCQCSAILPPVSWLFVLTTGAFSTRALTLTARFSTSPGSFSLALSRALPLCSIATRIFKENRLLSLLFIKVGSHSATLTTHEFPLITRVFKNKMFRVLVNLGGDKRVHKSELCVYLFFIFIASLSFSLVILFLPLLPLSSRMAKDSCPEQALLCSGTLSIAFYLLHHLRLSS